MSAILILLSQASAWAVDITNESDLQGMVLLSTSTDYDVTQNITMTTDFESYMLTGYTGTFDGGGYTIDNLTIVYDSNYVGLFATFSTGGTVQNVNLTDIDYSEVSAGDYRYIGGIVGYMLQGYITNCTVTGSITDGEYYKGGIAGYVQNYTISGCSFDGTLSGQSQSYCGGIIGYAYGSVPEASNCWSSGTISGQGQVGGIIGGNNSASYCTIDGSHSDADVTGTTDVGGLVGGAGQDIRADGAYYENGTVTATGNDCGGLIGDSAAGTVLTDCSVDGATISGVATVGGFIGYCRSGTITNCYVTGTTVTGSSTQIGGFYGYSIGTGTTSSCYVTDSCSITGSSNTGGFVGNHGGNDITLSYSNAPVSGISGADSIGGFIGINGGYTVDKCWATGKVSTAGGDSRYAGGFVGRQNNGVIIDCWCSGDVGDASYPWSYYVGGFVGRVEGGDTVRRSYSTGNVYQQSARNAAGGFCGYLYNNARLDNCFSVGRILAQGSNYQGLFLGYKYSTGTVTDCGAYDDSSGLYGIGSTSSAVDWEYTDPTAWYDKTEDVYDTGSYTWDFSTPVWYEYTDDYPKLVEQEISETDNAIFFGCHF